MFDSAEYRLDSYHHELELIIEEHTFSRKVIDHGCKKATELMSKPRVNVGE